MAARNVQLSNRAIANVFFYRDNNKSQTWTCKCGTKRVQKSDEYSIFVQIIQQKQNMELESPKKKRDRLRSTHNFDFFQLLKIARRFWMGNLQCSGSSAIC